MKNLPIGIQSFEDLRSTGCLYVDKTEGIYRLISSGKVYFLSRPRRFGKSLLVSTMEAIFKGKKELFEGLYIYDKWDWSQQFPVIRIDWTQISHATPDEMKVNMIGYLKEIAQKYRVSLSAQSIPDCFRELITSLYEQTGKKVVILIDEYDSPITDHLFDSHMDDIRKAMHDFYRVMKGADEYLRFIFLTGVSKFSGLSVFSALNNLDDITLDRSYASICGYTQAELENNFADYIAKAAQENEMSGNELLEEIKLWYNGYSWDGKTSVYNPFSTLSFFKKCQFDNYWFRTGTPTFLVELLKKRNKLSPVLEAMDADSSAFESYDPANLSEIPLLFQTGYLTIKRRTAIRTQTLYTLGIPNSEVRISFYKHLFTAYSKYPVEQLSSLVLNVQEQIHNGDASGLERNLTMLLANIPYKLQVKNEAYYHSLFLLLMKIMGFDIQGEILTSVGRIDAVWRQPGLTVVAEVKYHHKKKIGTLLDEAMKQIRDRRYYEAYLDRKVRLLAVAFTGKTVKCKLEEADCS
ncbi:MAG: ATP-binding protein [Prevotellaceae bacterium]|jgi:hypothetical protein|nr:ATP-binding protein [Prevotellaceae bacterium]